uniref:Tail fiber protein n=1 Tax=Burkholderia phage vB_BgluM-SURPRISE13 TaxID=3159457 RepID=A0AAU7PEU6_9VIRU
MSDPVTSYPVDYTGQAASNRIVDEQIVILPPGDRLFQFTMPQFAPFYEEGHSLKLRDINNNVTPLVLGVDYYLSHKFMDASLATMHPIWGSISFLKPISGVLLATYQTLGGIWTIDSATITEILMNTTQNPRVTTWEQVVERPVDFPVIDHPWDLADMVGMSEIYTVLENFYEAYLASLDPNGGGGGTSIILDHINNKNNPHATTAQQVGAYSTLQIDTMLGGYVTTTGTAANSTLFNGKSYAQMLTDVVSVKVANASSADNATHAGTADTATNANALGNKSLAQLMTDVAATKVANAAHADTADNATNAATASNSNALGGSSLTQVLQAAQAQTAADSAKFNGKNYADAKADILSGQAADSAMLGGQTLQQIITSLQQSTGDAATLNGKSYDDIMAAVKTTKVDNATNADTASNATSLGGQSLSQILTSVAGIVPDLSHNSEAVYGYTFDQLVEAIAQSQTWTDQQDYLCVDLDIENATLQHPATGGTADAAYSYLFLGSFPIPTTGANNEFYDPTQEVIGSSMDLFFFFGTNAIRARLDITFNADLSMGFNIYSDFGDLTNLVYFGAHSVPSTLKSSDGTKTGQTNEVYVKFKTSQALKRLGVFQYTKNSFVLDESEEVNLYDSTLLALNTTTWHSAQADAWNQTLSTSLGNEATARANADTAIRTDMQTALDTLADDITALIATPAA